VPKVHETMASEQERVATLDDLLIAERELLHKYQLQDLPEEDGVPLETYYHRLQIGLLHELTYQLFKDRTDFYCGGNMFLYYDLEQAEGVIQFVQGQRPSAPYKGPDFFVVLGGVDGTKKRKHWVVWREGGRYPDVIIEITSPSTKSEGHEGQLWSCIRRCFGRGSIIWYDEEAGELAGYRLQGADYVPIAPNERGVGCGARCWGCGWVCRTCRTMGWRYRWLRYYDRRGWQFSTDGGRDERLLREQAERQRAEAGTPTAPSKPSDASPSWKQNLGDCAANCKQGRTALPPCARAGENSRPPIVPLSRGIISRPEVRRCSKQAVLSQDAPAPIGPYSQAVRVGDWVFLSGQIPVDPHTGEVVAGGIEAQTRQVLQNLQAVLTALGLNLDSIVKTTIYLTDLSMFAEMNEVYETYFHPPYPARATVQVSALPKGVQVEIEAIAYAGG
jgi:2-iminobutanoate/2-iminopropanoate deaminase